jgi:uncharacterized sodium:solute symporter family permease YidK
MGTYLSLYAVSQAQVQRLLSVKTLKNAQLSLWWQWPILTSLSLTTSFSGLVIYWYYRTCDPLKANRINQRDQNMPIYIIDALGHLPGVAGLFVAGIFSASLSTVSTALNSLSALTLEESLFADQEKALCSVWQQFSITVKNLINDLRICVRGRSFSHAEFGGCVAGEFDDLRSGWWTVASSFHSWHVHKSR